MKNETNLYNLFCGTKKKKKLINISMFFHPYYGSQLFWTPLMFIIQTKIVEKISKYLFCVSKKEKVTQVWKNMRVRVIDKILDCYLIKPFC